MNLFASGWDWPQSNLHTAASIVFLKPKSDSATSHSKSSSMFLSYHDQNFYHGQRGPYTLASSYFSNLIFYFCPYYIFCSGHVSFLRSHEHTRLISSSGLLQLLFPLSEESFPDRSAEPLRSVKNICCMSLRLCSWLTYSNFVAIASQ